MVLSSDGPISFSALQSEFGGTKPIRMSQYYSGSTFVPTLGGIPLIGAISVGVFRNRGRPPLSCVSTATMTNWFDMSSLAATVNATIGNEVLTLPNLANPAANATLSAAGISTKHLKFQTNAVQGKPGLVAATETAQKVCYTGNGTPALAGNVVVAFVGRPLRASSTIYMHIGGTAGEWVAGAFQVLLDKTNYQFNNVIHNLNNYTTGYTLLNPPEDVIGVWQMSKTSATNMLAVARINGQQSSSVTLTPTTPQANLARLEFFGTNASFGSNRSFFGNVGEVAWWAPSASLSTADLQLIEGILAWKWWGNGSRLPTGHPYKTQTPAV